jgi:hypothetical protein
LEGVVEWAHHRSLVRVARADIRKELLKNHQDLAADLSSVRADQDRIGANIKLLVSLRSGKKIGNGHASLDYTYSWRSFRNTAWKTAQSSGALVYLDFDSEQDLAGI